MWQNYFFFNTLPAWGKSHPTKWAALGGKGRPDATANQTETPHLDIQVPSNDFKAKAIKSSLICLLCVRVPHIQEK